MINSKFDIYTCIVEKYCVDLQVEHVIYMYIYHRKTTIYKKYRYTNIKNDHYEKTF